jgi:hypothetical protein
MLATGGPTWPELLNLLANALYAAVGLYLFFGGKWIVDKAIPSNRPYCHECGYELTAATQNRCPECGTPFRLEDVMPKDIPDEIASLTTPADATGQRTSEGERLTSPEPTTDH